MARKVDDLAPRWDPRGFWIITRTSKTGQKHRHRMFAIPDYRPTCRHGGQDHNTVCAFCGAQIERTWHPTVPSVRPGLHDPIDQPRRAA